MKIWNGVFRGNKLKETPVELYEKLKNTFFVIAGPCVIEQEGLTLKIAEEIKRLRDELNIPFIFKASYDKANRTSIGSYRGPGLGEGLRILKKVKEDLGLPVISDCHWVEEVDEAKKVLDIIQIPALLARQTDLLVRAGASGCIVNLKKGQFMAPEDMFYAFEKVSHSGNQKVIFTERGTFFGYHNLVVDMRSIRILKKTNLPVVFDATHSVQRPSGGCGVSGGEREFIIPLAKAAVACGADGVFFEVHPDPSKALCDGPNSLPLAQLKEVVQELLKIYKVSGDGTMANG